MKYFIPILLILCSCSAQWHVKRAVKKDPTIVQVDTLSIIDSVHVVTNRVTKDSIFMVSKDTVTIVRDKLTMKHFYHNDSVYIYGECASDTVVKWKRFEVPIQKVVVNDPWFPKWLIPIAILIGIIILLLRIFGR